MTRHRAVIAAWGGAIIVIAAVIAGILLVNRAGDQVADSYAIAYDAVIEPAEYTALVEAVTRETGADHVVLLAIEHDEAPAGGPGEVSVQLITPAGAKHPKASVWQWDGAALTPAPDSREATESAARADALADSFSLGDIDPAVLNGIDERLRTAFHHGVTSTSLSVSLDDGEPRVAASGRQRGSEEYANLLARTDGSIIGGEACHATNHPTNHRVPTPYSCEPIE